MQLTKILMKEYTTLKIGGPADEVYIPISVEEVCRIQKSLKNEKITVIGKGSNLLVSSKGIRDKVIMTGSLKNHEFLDETLLCAIFKEVEDFYLIHQSLLEQFYLLMRALYSYV